MRLANWKQLKIRGDLVISTQTHQGKLVYVVKDPVTLRYFRLRPTEYAIVKMLDGSTPVSEVKDRLARLGHEIPDEELETFLKQLGAANFFENVLPDQSDNLYRMALFRRRQRSFWQQVKRILYIKMPLYDPDRVFNKLLPYVRFLWSKTAAFVYIALLILALYAFFTNLPDVYANWSGLWSVKGTIISLIIFALIVTLHELGHGMTCKYFGGEVHELGILLLVVFIPCLYCNVTDAWIQKKQSRKFLISAAGIFTELIIASIAALVWWATDAGVANSLAYRFMILSGSYSVVLNANPLMKFDGYYILSDAIAIPNLRASSVLYIKQFFRKYILGLNTPGVGRFGREEAIKLAYGVASTGWIFYVTYRIVRTLVHKLPPIGVWVLIMTVYGLVLVPLVRLAVSIAKWRGKSAGRVNAGRIAVLSAVAVALIYTLFFHNLSYPIVADCVIQPVGSHMVYASTEGVVTEVGCELGQEVEKDQVIARMQNRHLELDLAEMLLIRESYAMQADQAASRGDFATRDYWKSALAELDVTIAETQKRIDDLTVRAPSTGVIVAPSHATLEGNFVAKGSLLFAIADMTKARVTIAVDEKDLQFVRENAQAFITLRSHPWKVFEGRVESVSEAPWTVLPQPSLAADRGGGVVTRPDIARQKVAVTPTYEADITLPNDDPMRPLKPGMVGQAVIAYGERRRLWEVIYTRVRQNIRRSFGV